ncbi:MAG: ABC transporter permease [Thermotogaceae bacterium]|nr:ABC transporter permease [Thermotogaceae bacterium]
MDEISSVLFRSLYVNGTATLIASLIGVPLALLVDFFSFAGKKVLVLIFQSLTGIPPVLVGLLVYLMLSRNGPLGSLQLLFTSTAMILAQILIALPIIFSISYGHFSRVENRVRNVSRTLGANDFQVMSRVLLESSTGILTAVLTAFGRVVGEVGAVMMVGGNIQGRTRLMTTSIVLYTSRGEFDKAVKTGIVLLIVAFGVNVLAVVMSKAFHKRLQT